MREAPPSPHSTRGPTCPGVHSGSEGSRLDACASHRTVSGAQRALPAAPEPLAAQLTSVGAQVQRDAAFEAARLKFAFYGRRNAHVSHLGASGGQYGVHMASRGAVPLQNTLALQENGALAARLDEMRYLLDGILEPSRESSSADDTVKTRRLAVRTCSVLELVRLLQDPQLLKAVNLSSQRVALQTRLRAAVRLLQRPAQSGTSDVESCACSYRLALALLAYFLADSPEAEEFFDGKTLDTLVYTLKAELTRERSHEYGETRKPEQKESGAAQAKPVATEPGLSDAAKQSAPLRKTCLKRKRTAPLRTETHTTSDIEDAHTAATKGDADSKVVPSGRAAQTDEIAFRTQVAHLLRGHGALFVDGKLEACTVDVLCLVLHSLLQVDSAAAVTMSVDPSEQCQPRRDVNTKDAAGATFSLIHERKQRLVRNGGINALLFALSKRFARLDRSISPAQAALSASECAYPLRQARALLQVLDQASFLSTDVQRYMSEKKAVFALLFKIIRVLGSLGWGSLAPRRWEASPDVMVSTMEVLLTAMRVLINLTHHSDEAAKNVHDLRGMQLLARSFGGLWRFVEETSSTGAGGARLLAVMAEDKWAFDAFLMFLSAMANCVEFNTDNRLALVQAALSPIHAKANSAIIDQVGSSAVCRRNAVCDLLTRFFLVKVQSFVHLLDRTESVDADAATTIDEDAESWNPEDVILSGCTSLLLGFLMKGSSATSATILSALPDRSPRLLLRALGVFVAFHSQIGALTPELGQSVLQVEEVLMSLAGAPNNALQADVTVDSASVTWKVPSGRKDRPDATIDAAVKVDEVEIDVAVDQASAMSLEGLHANANVSYRPRGSVAFKARRLRNVCSSVDDSDSDNNSEIIPKTSAAFALEVKSTTSGDRMPGAMSSPKTQRSPKSPRTPKPPRTPKSPRTPKTPKAPTTPRTPLRASHSSQRGPRDGGVSGKSPKRASTPSHSARSGLSVVRATPKSTLQDGLLTSPTVLRLRKRTRQLVDELDAAFAEASPVRRVRSCGGNEQSAAALVRGNQSSSETATDWSGQYRDINNLDFSQDAVSERGGPPSSGKMISPQRVALGLSPYKRRRKATPSPGKPRIAGGGAASFSSTPATTPPPTPQRKKTDTCLLRTPTRRGRSPSVGQSPMSESPSLRKVKSAPNRPTTCTSAVFDFDE